jgi:AcrR family transcriptional regulator
MHNKKVKRELILDTAFALILENGYSNTKIIDIANTAGIGKGTVYEYFESKEAILLELVNTKVTRDFLDVCEAMEGAPTCRQKLSEYFRLEIETASKYKSNIIDFKNEFMYNSSPMSKKIIKAIEGIMIMQFERLLDVVKKGVATGEFKNIDPTAATACVMGCVSFCLEMFPGGSPCPEESFLDCVFHGLLA